MTQDPDSAALAERVAQLSDAEAISALEFVVRNREDDVDEEVYEVERDRLVEALKDPDARRELEEAAAEDQAPVARGELARATLLYLVEESPESAQAVEHAIEHPAELGLRDPFTLAVVGVVVLALRPTIDIERSEEGRWKFSFKTRPLKDSAMATVIGKLLGAASPGQGPPAA